MPGAGIWLSHKKKAPHVPLASLHPGMLRQTLIQIVWI
jgi:hypothetical protein